VTTPHSTSPMAAHHVVAPSSTWRLGRNCSLGPTQLLWGTCAVPLVTCAVSIIFLRMGYPLVALFALVQMLGILTSVLAFGWHAADKEELSLRDRRLRLTVRDGLRVSSQEWLAREVRVLPPEHDGQPITLLAGGHACEFGRHLSTSRRKAFAAELKRILDNEWAAPDAAPPQGASHVP
jgi:uncharacterized membrane protein